MDTNEIEEVVFWGVDSFHRAVFKSKKYRNYYGCTWKLQELHYGEDEVLKNITEDDLTFFGKSFGCEPMGTPVSNLKIVKSDKSEKGE